MSELKVELVYEKTCPNIGAARAQLVRAFAETGLSPQWQEWEVSSPQAPAHVHGYGSPTILVDGWDVSGVMREGDDYCCRVYAHTEGTNKGVPAVADIVRALQTTRPSTPTESQSRLRGLSLGGMSLPAIGVAFLPKLACPACWPAYAGLLSSMGIGFINYTPYLLPLTFFFVLIVVASLAFRARQRRGYKPLLLGLVAAGILLYGKFGYDSDGVMYVGLGLLVLASLWNSWPRQSPAANTACPACEGVVRK
jgi:mercuric ion transport protein